MKSRLLATCAAVAVVVATTSASGEEQTVPEPEVLQSGIVVDCGQWPPENDPELSPGFRANCEKNAKLIGYTRSWTLTSENVPKVVLDNPKSFRCGAVAENNIGYYCVGIR